MSCSSTDLEDDDEAVPCEWSGVSADDAWDVVDVTLSLNKRSRRWRSAITNRKTESR